MALLNPDRTIMNFLKNKITIFIASLISFIVALVIVYEKVGQLLDSSHSLTCSVNSLVTCAPVMAAWQSSLLGIPNPIYGIVCFAILCIIAFFAIFIKLPKWVWLCTLIGVTSGFVLVVWFVIQSLFVIVAVCIYCTTIWFMMIVIFWLIFSITIAEWKWHKLYFVIDYRSVFITFNILVLILIMWFAFPEKWMTIIGI